MMAIELNRHILSVLVKNKSGVLTRVSGLFARRGYNIESLVVCDTENLDYSRMTIVAKADNSEIAQIIKQLDKLIDVVNISLLDYNDCIARELMLIKIEVPPEKRPEIEATCKVYGASIVDLSEKSACLELTGKKSKLDAFIDIIGAYKILELARTGLTVLQRGVKK